MDRPVVYNFKRDECSSRGIFIFILILIIIIALLQFIGYMIWS